MAHSTDDSEIRALITRAAHLADEGSIDDYQQVYASDATWTMNASTQSGLDEIQASSRQRREAGITGPGAKSRHIVTTLHVAVDGDTSTAVSYLLFLTTTDAIPTIKKFAIYDDEFVRTDVGWRILRRVNRND